MDKLTKLNKDKAEIAFKVRNFTVWATMACATVYLIAEKIHANQVSAKLATGIASVIVGLGLYFGTKR